MGQGAPGDLDLTQFNDDNGNLRTGERSCARTIGASKVTYTYTHDAWNRLVKVVVGTDDRAIYQYNGLNWRTIKQAPGTTDTALRRRRHASPAHRTPPDITHRLPTHPCLQLGAASTTILCERLRDRKEER